MFRVITLIIILLSCEAPKKDYAIAIHGGAGAIPKTIPKEIAKEYEDGLKRALQHGVHRLKSGADGLDIVTEVIEILENDSLFNAGRGAVLTHDGTHELDASIMKGETFECGAITGVTTVKNPIKLARKVMEESKHVLFSGLGAEKFADQMNVERVENSYFTTKRRKKSLENVLNRIDKKGTVGVVLLDKNGNLFAGTSTGGMTNKQFGRVGDSPIIGAGTYANNATCAVSATGSGEEYIRYGIAQRVSNIMEYKKSSLSEAANHVIHDILKKGDGGIISVDKNGNISTPFNTSGMLRGVADSEGLFKVSIWE